MSGFRFATRKACYWLPIVLWTSGLNAQTCLVLSPATITTDGTARTAQMDLSLYSPPGAALAAVQWTFRYPSSSISSLTVDDGPALKSAGKTSICAGDAAAFNCLAVGANTKTIANGVIAKVTAALARGASTAAILITSSSGASTAGNLIPIPLRIQPPTGATVSPDCNLHPPQKVSTGGR